MARRLWHFELKGWRQIVAFDALLLSVVGLWAWVGHVQGSVCR